MKKLILTLIVLLMSTSAYAVSLESIILGDPPKTEALSSTDSVGFVLGLQAGPDLDDKNNEYAINAGLRINLFEIGPTVHIWPKTDIDTTWGIYTLRHLSYDDILLGKPFVGFEASLVGNGSMYAFLSGIDREIQPNLDLRIKGEYRNYRDALAQTHNDESNEFVGSASLLWRF